MPISAKNLMASIEAAHSAVRYANGKVGTEDQKNIQLQGAADGLCEALKEAGKDEVYWAAIANARGQWNSAEVSSLIDDLVQNKDGRLDALVELYRLCGYKPPSEAAEAVRGLVATIHAGTLLGIGQSSSSFQGRTSAQVGELAKDSFTRFSAQYCAAELQLKKSYKKAASKLAKNGINASLKKLVSIGSGAAMIVIAGYALPPIAERLPEPVKVVVCENKKLAPEALQPILTQTFCLLPNTGYVPRPVETNSKGTVSPAAEDDAAVKEAKQKAMEETTSKSKQGHSKKYRI